MEPFSYASDPWAPAKCEEDFRIRLVKLFPTTVSVPSSSNVTFEHPKLDCHIFWTSLNSKPSFKALSYCWGPATATRKIRINGNYSLDITESLYSALEHLQDQKDPMVIWIDQICINQKDDSEKSEQVAGMGKIYRSAEEVLVWVGPAENSSDLLFDVWTTVGSEAESWDMLSYYTRERHPLLMNIWDQVDPTDPETVQFNRICSLAVQLFDQR